MVTPEISDAIGEYVIYSHEYNQNHKIELLYPNTPSANLGIEVCSYFNSNHEFKKRIENFRYIAGHISQQ